MRSLVKRTRINIQGNIYGRKNPDCMYLFCHFNNALAISPSLTLLKALSGWRRQSWRQTRALSNEHNERGSRADCFTSCAPILTATQATICSDKQLEMRGSVVSLCNFLPVL